MPSRKMHADEVSTDASLVRRLLRAQFPSWSELSIEPVASTGTDNALYRLGRERLVRLPRIRSAVPHVEREHAWLPRLAPELPCAVPEPLAKGTPGEGYPWPWSVLRWLDGENSIVGQIAEPARLARDLAAFVVALRGVDPSGGPAAGRGAPLVERDRFTRDAIAALRGEVDGDAVTAVWESALRAPAYRGAPVWIHGDLSPGNVLCVNGRLVAVIDFGCLGIGDPACDAIAAWNLLPADARDEFREALEIDDATWLRARGWALSIALIQLPYYRDTNPALAANARHAIAELLGGRG